MAYRKARFHLDGDVVVEPHPQAKTEEAKRQGYIVLRFEKATSKEFRQLVVDGLNAAQIDAPVVWNR